MDEEEYLEHVSEIAVSLFRISIVVLVIYIPAVIGITSVFIGNDANGENAASGTIDYTHVADSSEFIFFGTASWIIAVLILIFVQVVSLYNLKPRKRLNVDLGGEEASGLTRKLNSLLERVRSEVTQIKYLWEMLLISMLALSSSVLLLTAGVATIFLGPLAVYLLFSLLGIAVAYTALILVPYSRITALAIILLFLATVGGYAVYTA